MKSQITDIQTQKNHPSRRSIFLDGRFFCGVSEDIVIKFQLKRGMEIDEDELKKLLSEEELLNAKNYAYRILARRMYTSKEIKDKLLERGYVNEVIQDVIAALEKYGYLNDKVYAEEWVQSRNRSNPKGKNVLRQELARKGIQQPIIEDVLSQEFDELKEKDVVLELALRRARLYSKDDPAKARRKLQSYLFRRGFDFETIKYVVEQVIKE